MPSEVVTNISFNFVFIMTLDYLRSYAGFKGHYTGHSHKVVIYFVHQYRYCQSLDAIILETIKDTRMWDVSLCLYKILIKDMLLCKK